MLSLFIVLLTFGESLPTKFLFLNGEPCMVRLTFIDMNPSELKYYPFIISLRKCTGRFNVFQKKQKTYLLKLFSMIANKDEVKVRTKHISCDCNFKFHRAICN